jgi:hypothetical protein
MLPRGDLDHRSRDVDPRRFRAPLGRSTGSVARARADVQHARALLHRHGVK